MLAIAGGIILAAVIVALIPIALFGLVIAGIGWFVFANFPTLIGVIAMWANAVALLMIYDRYTTPEFRRKMNSPIFLHRRRST